MAKVLKRISKTLSTSECIFEDSFEECGDYLAEDKELEKSLSPQYNIAPRFKIPAIARVDNEAPTISTY